MAIDDATRDRAQKFVQSGTTRVFADPNRFSGPAAKPPIITKEQMEKEGFTDLRDYLNFKSNLKRRPDKVDPDMGAKADKAFLDFVKDRNQPAAAPAALAAPADIPAARSEVKNTPNDLRAKSKEQQAIGAKLRGQTPGVLGENAAKLEKEFKNSLNVKDFLESSSYAKGGAVSASRRGDGIAQRGKTRGRVC